MTTSAYMWNLKTKGTNELIYKTEVESQRLVTVSLSSKGKGWGQGLNQELGINIYTLLYIKQVTNKDLLYSTGNSTQYSVMAYMGKESKRKNTSGYMYMYN